MTLRPAAEPADDLGDAPLWRLLLWAQTSLVVMAIWPFAKMAANPFLALLEARDLWVVLVGQSAIGSAHLVLTAVAIAALAVRGIGQWQRWQAPAGLIVGLLGVAWSVCMVAPAINDLVRYNTWCATSLRECQGWKERHIVGPETEPRRSTSK